MVTDPSLCPIPPGFEVIGGFNDDFRHFKDFTGYKNFIDKDGISRGSNSGVSKRWKNPNLRGAGIVCGFQFKIGPNLGERWRWNPKTQQKEILGEVKEGDVNIHFPRRDGPGGDRGGYMVAINWFKEAFAEDGITPLPVGEADLSKEIPHSVYGKENYFRTSNGKDEIKFRGEPNPRRDLHIRDGQWHSFLGVIYNDWYQGKEFPIIGLWYSQEATTDFTKFRLQGMGADLGNMQPRGPLKEEIGEDQHTIIDLDELLDLSFLPFTLDPERSIKDQILEKIQAGGDDLLSFGLLFSNNPAAFEAFQLIKEKTPTGDELFVAEHALQIRIDDVPSNEIEIRNVYAASVRYVGITPIQNHPRCSKEAKAIIDAQTNIENLKRIRDEAREKKNEFPPIGPGSEEFRHWENIEKNLNNEQIPLAWSHLRREEFMYGRCHEGFLDFLDQFAGGGNVGEGGNVVDPCHPFEKEVEAAQSVVNRLENRTRDILFRLDRPGLFSVERMKLMKELQDINKQAPPAKDKLTAARTALDNCKKNLPSDIGSA